VLPDFVFVEFVPVLALPPVSEFEPEPFETVPDELSQDGSVQSVEPKSLPSPDVSPEELLHVGSVGSHVSNESPKSLPNELSEQVGSVGSQLSPLHVGSVGSQELVSPPLQVGSVGSQPKDEPPSPELSVLPLPPLEELDELDAEAGALQALDEALDAAVFIPHVAVAVSVAFHVPVSTLLLASVTGPAVCEAVVAL